MFRLHIGERFGSMYRTSKEGIRHVGAVEKIERSFCTEAEGDRGRNIKTDVFDQPPLQVGKGMTWLKKEVLSVEGIRLIMISLAQPEGSRAVAKKVAFLVDHCLYLLPSFIPTGRRLLSSISQFRPHPDISPS